jgi:hypothetical protein
MLHCTADGGRLDSLYEEQGGYCSVSVILAKTSESTGLSTNLSYNDLY